MGSTQGDGYGEKGGSSGEKGSGYGTKGAGKGSPGCKGGFGGNTPYVYSNRSDRWKGQKGKSKGQGHTQAFSPPFVFVGESSVSNRFSPNIFFGIVGRGLGII